MIFKNTSKDQPLQWYKQIDIFFNWTHGEIKMKYLTTTIHEFIKKRILYLDLTVSKSTEKFCK